MKKCDCYCVEEKIIGWHTPVDPKTTIVYKCNGTRERDECSCGGDRIKCDFYPEVRQKALKEQEPKFGEWISVEYRLPEKDGRYLVAMKDGDDYHISTRKFRRCDTPIWWKGHTYSYGHWARNTAGVRYWMPLPEPPTE